jgi:DNA-binding transcriptional LysR family regulator
VSFSLKQIRYFVAAADSGQVSQAAVELNVSQSAVTAAIQQLEAALDLRLLDRNPSGV